MRLFVAVEIDDSLKSLLIGLQQELARAGGGSLRLMPPENLHLTLKFIGEISPDLVDDAKMLVFDTARVGFPFELALTGAGAFPERGPIRVCWAGLESSSSVLRKMAGELDESFEMLGIKPEKRAFKPHITVARTSRDPIDHDRIRKCLSSLSIEKRIQRIVEITLFQSHLSSDGSRYSVVERFPLGRLAAG